MRLSVVAELVEVGSFLAVGGVMLVTTAISFWSFMILDLEFLRRTSGVSRFRFKLELLFWTSEFLVELELLLRTVRRSKTVERNLGGCDVEAVDKEVGEMVSLLFSSYGLLPEGVVIELDFLRGGLPLILLYADVVDESIDDL